MQSLIDPLRICLSWSKWVLSKGVKSLLCVCVYVYAHCVLMQCRKQNGREQSTQRLWDMYPQTQMTQWQEGVNN